MKKTLHTALYEAGNILSGYLGQITEYSVKESQSSIVTRADIEAEKKILQIISDKFPGHNTLGEETGFQNRNSAFTWIIDPLDGTSNFAAGLPWFGVIICVLKNFNPFMAGCYLPFYSQLYFAEKGKGAKRNNRPISVSKEAELQNVLVSYSLDFSEEPGKTLRETKIIEGLVQKIRNLRATNSILDFCYTAEGKLGACINQSTKIWDIAAPALIIEEAGGKVSDIHGNPLNFNLNEKNADQIYTIISSNKPLHPEIVTLIQPFLAPP